MSAGSPVIRLYSAMRRRSVLVGAVLAVAILAAALVLLGYGSITISPAAIVDVFLGHGRPRDELVIMTIRLPHWLTGLAVGLALGAAGSVFQSISRNPLGSPDILGFSTGAATGALAQIIILGGSPLAVALSAVIGGLVASVLVYGLSRQRGGSGTYRLVLTGIGVAALLGALNSYLLTRGGLEQAARANVWLSGSLSGRDWLDVAVVGAAVVILLPPLILLGRRLALMEMGDDAARALGIRTERSRLLIIVLGVGLTAASVAAAGPIAFVALAAPQLVRRLIHGSAVPVGLSALMGALLLGCADIVSQWVFTRLSMPVGVVTALLGGAYLIYLLARKV